MSYVNLIMYGAVLPSYKSLRDRNGKDKSKRRRGGGDTTTIIKADDPANRERVRRVLDSIE